MKKFAKFPLIAMVAVISVAALSACNGSGSTVNVSWASSEVETLSYSIHDTSINPDYQSTLNVVGEATFVTDPKLTDAEKEDYDDATVKLTSTVKLDKVGTSETVFYANRYTVVHLTKTYTDATDVTKNYVLTADHSGKYYKYTLNYANAPEKNKSAALFSFAIPSAALVSHSPNGLFLYDHCPMGVTHAFDGALIAANWGNHDTIPRRV